MTNAELLAKFRAEIDKLYGEYKDKFHQCGDQYHLGLIDGLDMAEQVLDTLESEKPSGPAIEEPIDGVLYAAACGIKNATGKSEKPMQEGLEEEVKRYLQEEHDRDTTVGDVARHFAQWGAEHLKK